MAIMHTEDGKLCSADRSRPRTKFLTSFFYFCLFERSPYDVELLSTLRYFKNGDPKESRVDPLAYFSKWVIPVNISNVHWALMVVRVHDQKLEYYDSIPCAEDAQVRMKNVLKFIGDLAKATGRTDLAGLDQPGSSWTCSLVQSPRQDLDYDDCALFAILNALFEMSGQQITRKSYSHRDVYDLDIRTRVACEVLRFG